MKLEPIPYIYDCICCPGFKGNYDELEDHTRRTHPRYPPTGDFSAHKYSLKPMHICTNMGVHPLTGAVPAKRSLVNSTRVCYHPSMSRLPQLLDMSDQEVREWIQPKRARWTLAIDNTGMDGNVGAIVRGHNLCAGGGVHIVGRRKWHKRVSMGTYNYEPISYHPDMHTLKATLHQPLVSIEADSTLPPCDEYLRDDVCYVFGHDGVGLSPRSAAAMDARLGPPRGWNAATSSGTLAHLVMMRLRTRPATIATSYPEFHQQTPLWQPGWADATRDVQRQLLPMKWWVNAWPWPQHPWDWWLWMPDSQYSLNEGLVWRIAQAAGLRGIITASEAPIQSPYWRQMTNQQVSEYANGQQYPIYGLELGGRELPGQGLPSRGILALGHEQHGLDTQLAVHETVSLPQWGSNRSFNVAMSAAMAVDCIS